MDDIDISEPFDTDESEYFCDSNTIPSSDDSEKLYPSSQLTVVQCLAILFTWFCSYPGISKEAFSRLLCLLNSFLLPAGNILPTSYQKARVAIKHFLVPAQEYDCSSMIALFSENVQKEILNTFPVVPNVAKHVTNHVPKLQERNSSIFHLSHDSKECLVMK